MRIFQLKWFKIIGGYVRTNRAVSLNALVLSREEHKIS